MRWLITLLFLANSAVVDGRSDPADTIFINGNIYTVSERQPRAEAIAVKGDRIVFVGTNAHLQKFRANHTRVGDLAGNTNRAQFHRLARRSSASFTSIVSLRG